MNELGWQPDQSETAAHYWMLLGEWNKCGALGAIAAGPLKAGLNDSISTTDEEKGHIARILGQLKDPSVMDDLIVLLRERDEKLRRAAAESLKQLGWQPDQSETAAHFWLAIEEWDKCLNLGSVAIDPLKVVLDSTKDLAVAERAAEALGRIKDDRALEALLNALDGRAMFMSLEWVHAIVKVLGRVGDPRAINSLVTILSSTKIELHQTAFEALQQIGGPEAEKALGEYEKKRKELANMIDESVARLVAIYQENPDGFLKDSQAAPAEEIRSIGWALHRQGGFSLMQGVHGEFARVCGVRGAPRNLEYVWDGVGNWMS